MLSGIQKLVKRYDKWCESMGLTPDKRRSCVPVRVESDGNKACCCEQKGKCHTTKKEKEDKEENGK